jgi:thioester reductase-like protein
MCEITFLFPRIFVQGFRRLQKQAKMLGVDILSWSRVTVVLGDLALPLFGMSSFEYERIARCVDVIFHCGAVVNHVLPYSFHKAANVHGTIEVRVN